MNLNNKSKAKYMKNKYKHIGVLSESTETITEITRIKLHKLSLR